MIAALIVICHNCKQLDRADKSGKPACKIHGQHFMDHVKAEMCPIGIFSPAFTPAEIPAGYQTSDATKGRCCS
jgi:hypothetical protein